MTFINVFVRVRPDRRRAETDGHREAGDELAERLRLRGDARPREEIGEELPRGRPVSSQSVRQPSGAYGGSLCHLRCDRVAKLEGGRHAERAELQQEVA